MNNPVTSSPPPITEIPLFSRGKVRDVYDLGDTLLMVATDRLSAFDVVLPTPIPDKGKILTQLSVFWFNHLGVPSHFLSADLKDLPASLDRHRDYLRGRFMLVKKAKRFDVECVARGYLVGSGWKDYLATESVCGHALPPGLRLSCKLEPPLFTPAAKNDIGHDENIDFKTMAAMVGGADAERLRDLTLEIYSRARSFALQKGVIIADTKFEFGVVDGQTILIDEVLTPDSSRFWPADGYAEGREQDSFDKQYVRDYLNTLDWGKTYPGPELPAEVVKNTRRKYLEAFALLTGKEFRE
ncbi:MAG: phosphoribosylaminoimidazole-succinocarboxamide synthase [Fibrobacteres bacterium]|nr:phosphoribosylaminoimidazole-succinocarboxamide synthase [Fibrobacterota bacterium]